MLSIIVKNQHLANRKKSKLISYLEKNYLVNNKDMYLLEYSWFFTMVIHNNVDKIFLEHRTILTKIIKTTTKGLFIYSVDTTGGLWLFCIETSVCPKSVLTFKLIENLKRLSSKELTLLKHGLGGALVRSV